MRYLPGPYTNGHAAPGENRKYRSENHLRERRGTAVAPRCAGTVRGCAPEWSAELWAASGATMLNLARRRRSGKAHHVRALPSAPC